MQVQALGEVVARQAAEIFRGWYDELSYDDLYDVYSCEERVAVFKSFVAALADALGAKDWYADVNLDDEQVVGILFLKNGDVLYCDISARPLMDGVEEVFRQVYVMRLGKLVEENGNATT